MGEERQTKSCQFTLQLRAVSSDFAGILLLTLNTCAHHHQTCTSLHCRWIFISFLPHTTNTHTTNRGEPSDLECGRNTLLVDGELELLRWVRGGSPSLELCDGVRHLAATQSPRTKQWPIASGCFSKNHWFQVHFSPRFQGGLFVRGSDDEM